MTTDKIPTDAEIVRAFIDERDDILAMRQNVHSGNDAHARLDGHAEARRVLGERLEAAKRQRREAVEAAAVRVREALTEAAKGFAAFSEALSTAWERAGYAVQVDAEPDTEHDDE